MVKIQMTQSDQIPTNSRPLKSCSRKQKASIASYDINKTITNKYLYPIDFVSEANSKYYGLRSSVPQNIWIQKQFSLLNLQFQFQKLMISHPTRASRHDNKNQKKVPTSTQVTNSEDQTSSSCNGDDNFLALPTRPKGNHTNKFQRSKLSTNLYKVEFDSNLVISIYSVKIQPGIQHDSTKKLNNIINSIRKDVKSQLGQNFVISGRTIYSCEPARNIGQDIVKEAKFGNEVYQLSFRFVKKVEMQNISSQKGKDAILPLNFMNNLIKQFFNEMNYVEVGKSGKYVNPNSKHVLPNTGIILFTGYDATISMLENGLYLRVDGLTRIVQDRTVLQFINDFYMKNSHLPKQEKRFLLQQELIGKTVVANYGNSRHWHVTGVIFDLDLQGKNIAEETNMTYTEYYEKNYGMKIKNKKQPVLQAVVSNKKKSSAILIPEFLLISGLPDNFDERKRRQISEKTILSPSEKHQRIQSLISSLKSDSENFSSNALSQSLGVTISSEPEQVQAISLPPPQLQLGGRNSVESNKVAFFNLFNKPLYSNEIPLNIVAFIPEDYDFSSIVKLFDSTSKNFNIKHNIVTVKVRYNNQQKKVLGELQSFIEDKNGRFKDRNFCWFILPGNLKSIYSNIKRLCINAANPKLSQVALVPTLAKKGFASIVTKILIQISSKLGNAAWAPKIPKNFTKGAMIIAVQLCKDTQTKQTVISYCSTLNGECTKFYSNYRMSPSFTKFNERIKQICSQCLAAYGENNGTFPNELIFMKVGCSDSEKETLINKQISDIKASLKGLQTFQIKLTYVIVDLGSKHKFFLEKQNIINPSFGTLVNSKVVGRGYDFYMISQHCNKGTVKPVHYEIMYTDSDLQQGIMQEFIYGQCFNYSNWSGSVRVPGALQYARKLAKLVSQHLHCPIDNTELNKKLYYI